MVFDIIILALLVSGAFFGYKKGLVGILVSLIGLILSIVLGFILQTPVSNFIYSSTGFGDMISDNISQGMTQAYKNKIEGKSEDYGIYDSFLKSIVNEEQIDEVANNATLFIIKGLSFVIVFIVVLLICYILSMVLGLVFSFPILSTVNKFGGLGIGLAKSLLKIWVFLAILSFIIPVVNNQKLNNYIDNSSITKLLYENNLIVSLIDSSLKNSK